MANIKASAIATRIREVLLQAAGTARTISTSRFDGDLPDGLDQAEDARRAVTGARIEATIGDFRRSPASPPITGDLIIYDFGVTVRVVRLIERAAQLTDSERDAVHALAAEDVDVIRQALEYPGNLTETAAATSTGIVSGLLRWESSKPATVGRVNDGAQTLTTVHQFRGHAIARPS